MSDRKSAAMMAVPSKPKFVLSSPALSRQRSSTNIRQKMHHSSPTKPKKPKNGIGHVVRDISSFVHEASSNFNPRYLDFEKEMSDVLDKFQTHVEQFQAARAAAEQMIASFEQQIVDSHASYDRELAELKKWQAPAERIAHMQERVTQLRALLASSKEKLARIDREISLAEEQYMNENWQKKKINGTVVGMISILVLLSAIWYYNYYLA